MKKLFILVCLLAAAARVRGQDNIVEDYFKYLQGYIAPCADELKLSADEMRNVQVAGKADMEQLSCLKACVMKKMGVLTSSEINLDPINKMIEEIHKNDSNEIARVKVIAQECASDALGRGEECAIAARYTECYIERLMG